MKPTIANGIANGFNRHTVDNFCILAYELR